MLFNIVYSFLLTWKSLFFFLVTNIKYQVAAKVLCIFNVLCLIPFHRILSASLDFNLFLIALIVKKKLFEYSVSFYYFLSSKCQFRNEAYYNVNSIVCLFCFFMEICIRKVKNICDLTTSILISRTK